MNASAFAAIAAFAVFAANDHGEAAIDSSDSVENYWQPERRLIIYIYIYIHILFAVVAGSTHS